MTGHANYWSLELCCSSLPMHGYPFFFCELINNNVEHSVCQNFESTCNFGGLMPLFREV
jgi:hypothetical protein